MTEDNIYSDAIMGKILDGVGKGYFGQLDAFSNIIAKSYDVNRIRQGGEAMVGYSSGLQYLFGTPNQYYGGNYTIDVDYNSTGIASLVGDSDDELAFMLATGSISSAMEHAIFEQAFQLPSVSAVRVIEEAKSRGIPILNINNDNYVEQLSALEAPSFVKVDIQEAVIGGKSVTIPKNTIDFYQWHGTGYIVTDPVTGGSSYRLSGGLSGGATAVKVIVGTVGALGLAYQAMGIIELVGLIMMAETMGPFVFYCVVLYFSCMVFEKYVNDYIEYLETGDPALMRDLFIDCALGIGLMAAGKILVKYIPKALLLFKKVEPLLSDDLARLVLVGGDDFASLVARRGDDVIGYVAGYSDDVIRAVRTRGDVGLNALVSYGDDIALLIGRHADSGDDIIDVAIRYGADGLNLAKVHGVDALVAMKNGIDPGLISRLDGLGVAPVDYVKYNIVSKETAEAFEISIRATKNVDSNIVILGKYEGEIETSYQIVARNRGATYFELDNWDEVASTWGENNDMWEINKQFVRTQWNQGKEFIFSHNPYNATGFFLNEIDFLIDLGIQDIIVTNDGLWKAIR